ncbi:hypothetical protein CS542_03285 [Pedobacter sp. IW39]|nr:hypothetical protein CS542_03285 [Pedobacter sp. IW39]
MKIILLRTWRKPDRKAKLYGAFYVSKDENGYLKLIHLGWHDQGRKINDKAQSAGWIQSQNVVMAGGLILIRNQAIRKNRLLL